MFSQSVKNLTNDSNVRIRAVRLKYRVFSWARWGLNCLIFAAVKTDDCRGKMSHFNFISAELLHSSEMFLVGAELSQTIFVLFLFEILSLLTGYWCRAESSSTGGQWNVQWGGGTRGHRGPDCPPPRRTTQPARTLYPHAICNMSSWLILTCHHKIINYLIK